MANFVLVHGAWHGGWCWRDTARALRAQGHDVFTPTLSGVGERFRPGAADVTLDTHVHDICGVIEVEELDDAILCGHSYGGMVITGVADRMPGCIDALAYLDAFVPRHGESVMQLIADALPPEVAAVYIDGFRGSALHGGLMAPIPAETFNVKPQHRAWVDRRCAAQALATFEMPMLLQHPSVSSDIRRRYILAEGWEPSPFRHIAARCAAEPGWQIARLPCGHDAMVDLPDALAAELLKLV